MHTIIETQAFERSAKSAGLSEEEVWDIKMEVSCNPTIGKVMPGTGGARKLRIPASGKGKSGGGRVVYYFGAEDVPVFLLEVFTKGEKVDLTKAECNELRAYLQGLAEDYRESVRQKVELLSGRVS